MQIEWQIPLASPPKIAQIGIGVHGQNGVERYQLPDLWCLHLYRYEASVTLGGTDFPILPGYASVVPANMPMEYHFRGRSSHLYVHFHCQYENSEEETKPIYAMQDLGDDFGRIYEQLHQVVNSETTRAQARLWEVLWQLAERPASMPAGEAATHPAVRMALSLIDRHLDQPLRVAQIALATGVSNSYLARLFGDTLGVTVVGYIKQRRVQRAAHLLRHSTLPVKTIAAQVGLADLHQFNKAIHAALGQSPRAVRSCAVHSLAAPISPDETLRTVPD